MKNIKFIIIYLSAFLTLASCKKDSLMFFDDNNYLYVNLTKEATQIYPQRSFTFTFGAETVQEKVFQIPVKFAGRVSDIDRTFKISVIDTLTTAINGEDFEIVNDNQKILAGKADGFIELKLKRTAKMKTATYNIAFKIEDNENFKSGQEPIGKILVSDRLIKPEWWDAYHVRLLGTYSNLKCLLWLEYMNVNDGSDPWTATPYQGLTFGVLGISDAKAKSSVLGFKNWLRTEKSDPFDTELNNTVILSLGTSY